MTPARLLREAEKIGPATIALWRSRIPSRASAHAWHLGVSRSAAALDTQPDWNPAPGGLTHGETGTTDVKERWTPDIRLLAGRGAC
jgi:hypothetical protein